MFLTRPCLRCHSTKRGQRTILKVLPPVSQYMRQAVESGVYRTEEELEAIEEIARKERVTFEDEDRYLADMGRRKLLRGHFVDEYPFMYHAMETCPPVAEIPRSPRVKPPPLPTDKLVSEYLRRQPKMDIDKETYYRRLLEVEPPKDTATTFAQKTDLMQKAYMFATKQFHVMRTQNLSEKDALEYVEELLENDQKDERDVSRQTAMEIREWQEKRSEQDEELDWRKKIPLPDDYEEDLDMNVPLSAFDDKAAFEDLKSSFPSILKGRPDVIRGMVIWSRRLQTVPYYQWTIGATTALDHWVALQILDLKESSWQAILAGHVDEHLKSRARDIITVRTSLFPETKEVAPPEATPLSLEDLDEGSEGGRGQLTNLLASLKTLEEQGQKDDESSTMEKDYDGLFDEEDAVDQDEKVDQLMDELQEWRAKNVVAPYEEWPATEKDEFQKWLEGFVSTVSSKNDFVDMEQTRKNLLKDPPQTREESDAFWSHLQDEALAEELLRKMWEQGPPEEGNPEHKVFWDLDYSLARERLMNLGALRPLLNEYTKESNRVKFMEKYGDILLNGVEMEHLVEDPLGAIQAKDLGEAAGDVAPTTRFRIARVPYGSDEYGTPASQQARLYYQAWNAHKSNRARYEELMFRKGKLGLRYSDMPIKKLMKKRYEEED